MVKRVLCSDIIHEDHNLDRAKRMQILQRKQEEERQRTTYCANLEEGRLWMMGTKALASRLIGFIEGKTHEAGIQISKTELGSTEGVKKLLEGLDKVFPITIRYEA